MAAEADAADLSADGAAASVRQLPFTRAFIDETLRLYPPAFLIVREALGPDEVAGAAYRSRHSGQHVALGAAPAPAVFGTTPTGSTPRASCQGRPRRRATPTCRSGPGRASAWGAQFALTEAVIVMARLMRAFRLEFFGRGTVMPRGFVTTQPDRPVRFILTQRRSRLH